MFLLNSVSATEQPTQQFNKIFLSPFYIGSSVQNVNIPFTLIVNPPDKIKNVISATINFDIWINPSVNFILLINGQSCNNPSYYISTTYASAGKTTISFDCSNVITKSGNYSVVLKGTKDTGALTGWLDLTYINNPLGNIEISGTEYTAGDLATIFIQLKDNQGLTINNGSCYLNIWYPSTTNLTHTQTIFNSPMMKAEGSEGLYYYDIVAPSSLGVYMLSARCSYSFSNTWVYDLSGTEINKPLRTITTGTYAGDTIFLNDFEDWIYTTCGSGGGGTKTCDAYYDYNLSIHYGTNYSLISNMDLFYMGEASVKAVISFQVWNWTSSSWIGLTNNLTFSGLASSVPVGVGDFASNSIPVSDTISSNGIIRIRTLSTSGNSFSQFDNWLNIEVKKTTGIIQDIKGSGEIHVTNLPQAISNLNLTTNINYSQVAQSIWNYTDRNLTYYPTINETSIASAIWSWTGGISSSILGFFSNDIWDYATRTLTFTQDVTNYSKIAEYVWVFSDRNLTFYQMNNIAPEDIWNYASRNLTFTEGVTNYSQIAEYVWFYVDRNLTTYPTNNITAGEIWDYYNRSLTDDIPLQIWSYPDRNLTTDIPFDVWSYYNRTLTYYTLNLTELIEMINEYEFTDTPILIPNFDGNQLTSYSLNVTLIVPV
jgi:hypothetical protein